MLQTGEQGENENTERGKREFYYDKQVKRAVTVLNYVLKGL